MSGPHSPNYYQPARGIETNGYVRTTHRTTQKAEHGAVFHCCPYALTENMIDINTPRTARITFVAVCENGIWKMNIGPVFLQFPTFEKFVEFLAESQCGVKLDWDEESLE